MDMDMDTDLLADQDAMVAEALKMRYSSLARIGKGQFGLVYAATDDAAPTDGDDCRPGKVALKYIRNVLQSPADAKRVVMEMLLSQHLRHPNLVTASHMGSVDGGSTVWMAFERMDMDLGRAIGTLCLSPLHHKVLMFQLLGGLAHMHAAGVLHRDLKPSNVLVNANMALKICDYGLARVVDDQPTAVQMSGYVVTRYYRAPELIGFFDTVYTTAVDVWSCGCIFAELLLRRPLFAGRDAVGMLKLIVGLLGKPRDEVIDAIRNAKTRRFLHALSPALQPRPFYHAFPQADADAHDLLERMLAFHPAERISAAEALNHPYFADLPAPVRACVTQSAPPMDAGAQAYIAAAQRVLDVARDPCVGRTFIDGIAQMYATPAAAESPVDLACSEALTSDASEASSEGLASEDASDASVSSSPWTHPTRLLPPTQTVCL